MSFCRISKETTELVEHQIWYT